MFIEYHTSKDEMFTTLANDLMTGMAGADGVSSFYDFPDEDHYGKKVCVCAGTDQEATSPMKSANSDKQALLTSVAAIKFLPSRVGDEFTHNR